MDDDSALFSSSPVAAADPFDDLPRTPRTPRTPKTPSSKPTAAASSQQQQQQQTPFDAEEARAAALQRELEGVRQVNEAIEGVIATLERSRGSMKTVAGTVANASSLLGTWTRLLSQTEHNQRLVLDPGWQGATQDLQDAEAEARQRQQEAERRAAEAQRRRDEAKRKAEEDEQRRRLGTSASTSSSTTGRGTRGGLRPTRSTRSRYTVSGTSRYAIGSGSSSSSRGARSTNTNTNTNTSTTSSRAADSSTSSGIYSSRGGSNIGRGIARGTRGTRGTGRGGSVR